MARKACGLAQERKPDLVVLDMLLPKLSGPDVLQALRQDAETAIHSGDGADQPSAVQ